MKSYLCLPSILGIAWVSNLVADPLPQPQVSLHAGTSGTWNADWEGVAMRSYFSQVSITLTSWDYAPLIKFSHGVQKLGALTNSAPKFFFRLKYTDAPTTEPNMEDFDNDGIGSLMELRIGRDPLAAEPNVDTDGDGIADAIELFWYQNLTAMNATSDADGDGISDLIEALAGSDPKTDESADIKTRSNYEYDAMGRLTKAEDTSYTFDIEGNLESSN